jgi:hypothetical protein
MMARTTARLQLGLYSVALEAMGGPGARPSRLVLESMEDGRVGEAPAEAHDEALVALARTAEGVTMRDFRASPVYQKCKSCGFSAMCPHAATRPQAAVVPADVPAPVTEVAQGMRVGAHTGAG